MDTKERILSILEERRGQVVSGAEIGRSLEISRNAVWKAINQLKAEGHKIEPSSNKGYRLSTDDDTLSLAGILPFLTSGSSINPRQIEAHQIEVRQTVSSTNTLAKEMAISGAPHGTTIIANEQTAGRGRYGRSFFSPAGHGIYMSLVLDPARMGFDEPAITTIYTAVAVCEAIESVCEIKPQIKWVNDLFLNGKKICGISAEAVMDLVTGSTVQWIVVGVGVNFIPHELPEELVPIVGALYEMRENGKPNTTRNRLAAEIINRLMAADTDDLIARYRERLFVLGKEVLVEGNEPYTATVLDINERGHLYVQKKDGEVKTLTAGEISIRPRF